MDRAINNRTGINAKTKEKILRVVDEQNYCPNHAARSLALGRTKTIGVVCFDLKNYLFAEFIDILEEKTKEKGYYLSLVLTNGDPKKELEGLGYLKRLNVDGIIVFPVNKGEKYELFLKRLKIPIVTLFNRLSEQFACVSVNSRDVYRKLVPELIWKGYQKIVFVNSNITQKEEKNMNVFVLSERYKGYCDGLEETNFHEPILIEGLTESTIFKMLDKYPEEKIAFLCINDMYAMYILKICREKGIAIPDKVGIVGHDNIEILQYMDIRVTTIGYDIGQVAQIICDKLFDRLLNHNDQYPAQGNSFVEAYVVGGNTI